MLDWTSSANGTLRSAHGVSKLSVSVLDGKEPMERGIEWAKGRFPARAVLVGCWMAGFPAEVVLF